jgi:glycosyltransferase involved in cell wall biosynthesis
MKLNVLLYSYDWLPLVGGIQTVTADLAEGLCEWSSAHKDDPVHVTLITETSAAGMDDSRLRFPVIRQPRLRELIDHIRSADVVHLANPTLLPLALAFFLRKPTVVEHHGYQSICPNGLLLYGPDTSICPGHYMAGRYGKCLECNTTKMGRASSWRNLILTFPRRWLCKCANVNVAVSDHVARRLSLPRTRTIFHGIRITNFGESWPSTADPPRIGYVGRLVSEKGIPILFEAAKKLSDEGFSFHLALIGDGAEREALEREARRLGLQDRITFTGYLSGAAFEEAVRALRVVVMPSQWEETAGLAVMEKMMRGGLVVVADVGGLSEVVGDAGLKFTPGDANALHSQLRRVLENPSIVATVSSAARARAVKHFNRDSMIESHIALYREVSPR